MSEHRLRRKHSSGGDEASSGWVDLTLALWVVAGFLGGFVGAHYVLGRALAAGDSEMAIGILGSWLL